MTTVDTCEKILKGDVRGFIGLGRNFLRAAPERSLMKPAWSRLRLSVQIPTKLNRTHLIPGEVSYLLPCLGRIEIDQQATGPQPLRWKSRPRASTDAADGVNRSRMIFYLSRRSSQIVASRKSGRLRSARRVTLLSDLLDYDHICLCGGTAATLRL